MAPVSRERVEATSGDIEDAEVVRAPTDTIAHQRLSDVENEKSVSLGLNDLDPHVAKRFEEVLQAAALAGRSRTEAQKQLLSAILRYRWFGSEWTPFLPVGAAYASVMIGSQLVSYPWAMWTLFGGSFVFSGLSFWHTLRRDITVGFRTKLPPEVLLAAAPLLSLTPIEEVYTTTASHLLAVTSVLGRDDASALLERLNSLLTIDRAQAESQRLLDEAVALSPVKTAEESLAAMTSQHAMTTDPEVRESLGRGIDSASSRLAGAQTLSLKRDRLLAERDANQEALAAALTSLLLLRTARPAASEVSEKREEVMAALQNRIAAQESAQREVAGLLTAHAVEVDEAGESKVGVLR